MISSFSSRIACCRFVARARDRTPCSWLPIFSARVLCSAPSVRACFKRNRCSLTAFAGAESVARVCFDRSGNFEMSPSVIDTLSASSSPRRSASTSTCFLALSICPSRRSICSSRASTQVACSEAASILPCRSNRRLLTGNCSFLTRNSRRFALTSSILDLLSSIIASIWTSCPGASSGSADWVSVSAMDFSSASRCFQVSKTLVAISTQRASRSQATIRSDDVSISCCCDRRWLASSLQRRPCRVSCSTSSRNFSRLRIIAAILPASSASTTLSLPTMLLRPSRKLRRTSTSETRSSPLDNLYNSSAASVPSSVLSSCNSRMPIANTFVKIGSSIWPNRLLSRCWPWDNPSCPVTLRFPVTPVSVSWLVRRIWYPPPGPVTRIAPPGVPPKTGGM